MNLFGPEANRTVLLDRDAHLLGAQALGHDHGPHLLERPPAPRRRRPQAPPEDHAHGLHAAGAAQLRRADESDDRGRARGLGPGGGAVPRVPRLQGADPRHGGVDLRRRRPRPGRGAHEPGLRGHGGRVDVAGPPANPGARVLPRARRPRVARAHVPRAPAEEARERRPRHVHASLPGRDRGRAPSRGRGNRGPHGLPHDGRPRHHDEHPHVDDLRARAPPAWQERVRDESRALGKERVEFEDLDRLAGARARHEGDAAPLPAAPGDPARGDRRSSSSGATAFRPARWW